MRGWGVFLNRVAGSCVEGSGSRPFCTVEPCYEARVEMRKERERNVEVVSGGLIL